MKTKATWSYPIKLLSRKKHNLIYYINLDNIPEEPGCYVFYTKYAGSISMHYIGKANNLKSRIKEQLNNVRLMMGIKNYMNGKKFLMYFLVDGGLKTKKKKIVKLEKQLIKYATLEGHELINKIGTKLKFDTVNFSGNMDSGKMFGRNMNILK